jgi:phosphoglycolate phosphatase-like HAD superfamily hydrolase
MSVLLFDIDGTLVSSGGAGKAAMEQALTTAFGVDGRSDGIPFSGRTDRAIGRDLFQRHAVAETPENWERFLAAYLGHLPHCLARHDGRVLPGIAALLQRLQALGHVTLGLLTGNIRDGARVKLGHFGLFHYFAFGGFGDEHLERDDVAREAMAFAREHRNGEVQAEEVWVIGDTPLDVSCARAIGARVAAVATGWHTLEQLQAAQPDLLFNDLADAAPLLERISKSEIRISNSASNPKSE